MSHQRTILGSLASFGVALVVLISTAGAASAQEAPPATSPDDVGIGEPLFVERPAPRPDAANELRADPAPADSTSAPAPTPASDAPAAPATAAPTPSTPAPVAPATSAARTPAPARRVTSAPAARATEVQGVQIERSASPAVDLATTTLAVTGADREAGLTALAVALVALGAALVRFGRSPRTIE